MDKRKTTSFQPARNAGKGDLTRGSVRAHLVRLTLPMTWGILAIISFQLVDMFYISLLGTRELAAISFTFPVTYTIFSLVMGMTIAAASVLSRQIGRGNWARVRRLTTHALLIAALTGLVAAVLGYAFMDPLFRAMGADEDTLSLIRDYMVIWFLGSIFINTPMVGNAAMRAAGDAVTPAIIMTVVALVNVILDPIMIFGLFGFPRMEMQGAALSTVLANGCAMVAGLYVIARKKHMLTRSRRHMRLFADSARRFMFIAIPAGITNTIQPLTNAVLVALLAASGHEAVAAFGVATRVEAFAFVIIMGLSVAMAPVIGQNFGAGKRDRVAETLRSAILFCVIWSAGVALVLAVFAHPVADIFSDDAAVIEAAVLYFWIVPVTYIFGNLVPGWASAFNAMGAPQRAFIMIFIRYVAAAIPLAFIGAHLYGAAGIFGAIAVSNILTGIGFHLWNRNYCRDKAFAEPSPSTR